MKAGVLKKVTKTTPVAGAKGRLVAELECTHVVVRSVSSTGSAAICPTCTAARDAAKPAPGADPRDALIAELRKQNEYLKALANLAPVKANGATATMQPPPPAIVPAPVVPPKPADDVRECKKCKHVGLISEDFGWRLLGGKTWVPQSLCKKCNAANMSVGRSRWLASQRAAVV